MKYLVGLSGGVDSSVAALILKQQGHEVIGATMAIWGKEDIEEARKIAEQIGIPYYVFDCAEKYERIVLDNFKKEYLEGRTPNPCVWCNAQVKFGLLPQLAKANGVEFDKFATGHYARVEEENGRFLLKRGVAPKKDQSYFLYRLTQEQLKGIYLPLGGKTKDEIREIAKANGLNSAEKPDSQDFYGGDYNELLNIEDKIGNIVDLNGKVLGTHKGIWNYTIGQRKGLGIAAAEPLYVLELRKDTNEVVVGFADKTFKNSLVANKLNWIAIDKLTEEMNVTAKIRSTQQPVPVKIIPMGEDEVKVVFEDAQKSIAIGQSAVFYQDDVVLGGGIIASVE